MTDSILRIIATAPKFKKYGYEVPMIGKTFVTFGGVDKKPCSKTEGDWFLPIKFTLISNVPYNNLNDDISVDIDNQETSYMNILVEYVKANYPNVDLNARHTEICIIVHDTTSHSVVSDDMLPPSVSTLSSEKISMYISFLP